MRGIWLLLLVGCSGSSSSQPDAAAVVDAPPCVQRVSFNPIGLRAIAVDGSSILASLQGGLMEIPLDGSTPIGVATSSSNIVVASHDGVGAYAILTATATEIRMRDGTVIATLPLYETLIGARMTTTDFFLLVHDGERQLFVRVPRAGGPIVTFDASYVSSFEAGATQLAFTRPFGTAHLLSFASGEVTNVIGDDHYATRVAVVGDLAFSLTADYDNQYLQRFAPAGTVMELPRTAGTLNIFGDDRYLYVAKQRATSPFDTLSITVIDPNTLEQHPSVICSELTYANAFDATNLYGLQQYPGMTKVDVLIAPRPQ